MSETTMLIRNADMHYGPLEHCHGGEGALDFTSVLDRQTAGSPHVNFLHHDILSPGVSIGVHTHEDDTEYYYIIDGRGTMTLDGETHRVEAGDITAVFPGGSHGLVNDSDRPLRIIVLSVC
jgi:oxalate decarboxylase/phosphoglucose isomerase-like protein (cupin superfamily)